MMLAKLLSKDIVLGTLFVVLALYWWMRRSKLRLPPGPVGLPILGYIPFLSKDPHEDFVELKKKYGDIFSLYLGRTYVVVLNEFRLVKEAFNHPDILDRPPDVFSFFPDGMGFSELNGADWIEQRRYSMRGLRDIGLGKSGWIELLEAEVSDFVKFLDANAGKPLNIVKPLLASVSNNITSLIFGERLLSGDPRRNIVDGGVESAVQVFQQAGIASFFPKLLSFIAQIGLSSFAKERKKMVAFNRFIRNEVEKRKGGMVNVIEEVFIDGYLKEIEKHKNDPETSFNEKGLIGTAQSFVVGGSDTSKTSILWLLLGMVAYPEVQKKVHKEIDLVLGKDGKCTWYERNKLPYTYATVMEAQRWRTVGPLNVMHRTSQDVKIGGYDIPKGTNVMANTYALHCDSNYWKEPEKFIPERFLLEDGKLMVQKHESYTPFSIGRRNCPGEFVALIEIFHYFCSIMQRFRVHMPPGKMPILDGILGAAYVPIPQDLVFTLRE